MATIPTWSYKQGGSKAGFHCRYVFFQWFSTEVKAGGGMTKHKKALTFVAQ